MERQKGTKTKETVANQSLRSPYLLFILLSFLFSSLHKPLFSLRFKRAMEWERISAADASAAGNYDVFGGFVDVIRVQAMTEEQIDVLRGQISAYSVISEQLVEMLHKTTSTKHLDSPSLSGMVKMSSLHSDPLMATGASKPSKLFGRQRWSPTPTQLQILESLFYQGNGTPSKERIKEIAFELSQHGPIAETNVYNWFQNRRARSKRKKTATAARKNAESGAEGESPSERKVKSNVMLPPALADAMQSPADVSSELRVIDQDLQFCGCSNEMMVWPNSLSDPAFDHFMTSVETQGTSGVSCWSGETFH